MRSQPKGAIDLQPRDTVVIGGSAGSIEALKKVVCELPADFSGSLFVVIHTSPDAPSMLARVLANCSPLPASNPHDREEIRRGHIYVSRPGHHMTIEDGRIRILRGPRENRHRPAIDPLFRTAARNYGPRVVGIILSGLQDDGSAGLYAVKQRGGVAIVQEPADAIWKDMPTGAIEYSDPQYILPASDVPAVLIELAKPQESKLDLARKNSVPRKTNGRNNKRTSVSPGQRDKPDVNKDVAYPEESEGTPSVFACPECHGVLWELKDENMVRFRCRVGHSYEPESLTRELSQASEPALWAAVRALEEKASMQRRVAEGMGLNPGMSSRLLDQSSADAGNARLIRDMIFRCDAEVEPQEYVSEEKPGPENRKTA